MNVKQLIAELEKFGDDEEVIVWIDFADNKGEISDVEGVSRNGPGPQIEIKSIRKD